MIALAALLLALPANETTALPSFPELAEFAPAAESAEAPTEPKWTGSVTLGANWTGGNTRTTALNGTADAEYRRPKDRTTIGLVYANSKNRIHDVVSEDRYGARAKYDYFFSEKTYGLVQSSYDVDTVASLRSRSTLGVGAGRQFREDETWKLSGEAGVTWKDEEYPHGQGGDDIAARFAYNADWHKRKNLGLSQTTTVLPVIDDFEDVFVSVDTRVKTNLTENMFGQLQWLLEHDETPAAGKDKTDHRVLLSVGWSF